MTDDINPLTALIKPWRGQLVTAANQGDTKAQQIINLYQMYVACPSDQAPAALCKAAFEEWRSMRT